jgi:hypothetical protein
MSRRYYSSIAERTTLSFAVNATTTTFIVNAVVGWPSNTPYTLIIDVDTINEEIVTVTNRSGTTLTVTRGVDGSTAKTHDSGADVRHGVSARDFDEPNAHLNDTTTAHGLTIADVVTLAGTQTLTNKTLTTPTIASFANANHNHQASAGGGTLTVAAISDIASNYAPLNLTLNPQTASYTLVLGDSAKQVEMNVASANTLTVPPNSSVAFPVGTTILVVQIGAGQTTLTAGSGVTINSTPGLKLRTQWSTSTLVKRATDTWLAFGDLSA